MLNGVYEKKYKCPSCHSTASVIRKTKRGYALRYYCKACQKHFSINPCCFVNRKLILSDHLDGVSFRALVRKYRLSPMTAWRICEKQLKRLPNNNQFTLNMTSPLSRWLLPSLTTPGVNSSFT